MKTFGKIVCVALIGATVAAGSATANEKEQQTSSCSGHDHANHALGAAGHKGELAVAETETSPTVGYWAYRTVTHFYGNHVWTQVAYVRLGSWNRVRCTGCPYFFDVYVPY